MDEPANLPAVAVVGRPNVGKSALFNRLVGRDIAIVHDQPGITRDRISGTSRRGDRPFLVWDTAGIVGPGESELTRDVGRVVKEAIDQSDLLLFVVDAKSGLSPTDAEIAQLLRKTRKPVIVVVNKIDHEKHETLAADFDSLGFEHGVSISAAHGRGLGDLLDTINRLLPATGSQIDQPAPGLEQQPLSIAIVGRPNVGKSSLINAIIKSDRAIVSEISGTTRDAVDIVYQHESDRFVFIDTAGIRRRGAHSSSVEVFSVMRAERSIRRADLCILMVDLTSGVTAQDKRIAGLIQKSNCPCIVVLNKWDLVKPKRGVSNAIIDVVKQTRANLFFLDYAPVLVASAKTHENVERLFHLVDKVKRDAAKRIGTGVLNRLLRSAFAANPPPMISGKRLKLFYSAQASGTEDETPPIPKSRSGRKTSSRPRRVHPIQPPQFVLFVNSPRLINDPYQRYLEGQIRAAEPYAGLPILLTLRARSTSL